MATTPKRTRHGDTAALEDAAVTEGEPIEAPTEEAPATSVGEPEETAVSSTGKTCVNCGKPAVYRTTGQGADEIYFCEEDRPPSEPVERLEA